MSSDLGLGQEAEGKSQGAWAGRGAVSKPGACQTLLSMAGAPCKLLWEHGTGPSPQPHLATLTRHPAPIGGYQPECPRPTGVHGLEQKALRFTLVVLLSSYCLCVCEGLSFPGTGRGAEKGAGGRKFQSPLALKLGQYSLHKRSLTPKALVAASPTLRTHR